jgi:hypothetical protein
MTEQIKIWKLKHQTVRAEARKIRGNTQLKLRCPVCKKEHWAWYSSVYSSRVWKCLKCSKASQRLPLGVKWHGKLTPVAFVKEGTCGRRATYLFQCDCGHQIEAEAHNCIRSCGCLKKQPRPKLRLTDGINALNHLWHTYKNSAKRKGRLFSVTKAEFSLLATSNCYYCGREPALRTFHLSHRSVKSNLNGIDRVDSSLGYTTGNVKSCCFQCNQAKSDFSATDFFKWVHAVCKLHP